MIAISGTRVRPVLSRRLTPSLRLHPRMRDDQCRLQQFAHSSREAKKKIPLWYPIVGGLFITTAGGIKWFHDHVGGTEGLVRSASFYSYAIPKYIQYRYHMYMQSPDDVWEELDRDTSQGALQKIRSLGGFYIKAGQLASNLSAFPEIWRETMGVLQDQCPSEDFETIRSIISNELDFDKTFASFEKEPIGAASIGQVHRAILKDGTRVVVKVKFPKAEPLLRGDVRTIKAFAQLAQPVHVPALEQIEKQFAEEFDYRDEARHLATVRENLIRAGLAGKSDSEDKLCLIPKPYLDLCTESVLVMEELKGEKLEVALKKETKALAEAKGESLEEFMKATKEKEQEAKSRGDELRGPTSKQYDVLISILDGKRKASNAMRRLHNATIGWLPGIPKKEYQDRSALPLNHAKLVDDLIHIHGHEILVDGYFNGDPHPGNVILVRGRDGAPHIGLIDYGSTKQLSKGQRHLFCKIVIALAEDNTAEIATLMKRAGFRSEKMDPQVIYLYTKVHYDEDNDELTGGKHVQVFVEDLQARDPIKAIPEDYCLISAASIRLRGLAHAVHQPRSLAKAWKPIAEKVLKEDL